MARQKGLAQSRSASVEPSAATVHRTVAFHGSSPVGLLQTCNRSGTSRLGSEIGTPEGTRTPDLLLRRQLRYPAELLAHLLERVTGIGPAYRAWMAGVLPLNYTRRFRILRYSARKF